MRRTIASLRTRWSALPQTAHWLLAGTGLAVAVVIPPLELNGPQAWLRGPAYGIAVVMIAYVVTEAWALRRAISDFQAGMDVATRLGGAKAGATSAQLVVDSIGDFTSPRDLKRAIVVAFGCVAALTFLLASLFYGLAARSGVYDPIGIGGHGYPAFLAYVADYASLRGFFGFLDLFDGFNLQETFGWAEVFPRQLKASQALVLGVSLGLLKLFSQIVAVGIVIVIARIVVLRRRFPHLFGREQRTAAVRA